ncbi:MAG: PD40 domain-containing protein [Bacteroidales bacterium]|nr:PD40 domain-containing protein [Bacteroidales bacterium]
MKRTVLLILAWLTLVSLGFSQHPKKAVKAYEAAEEAFMRRDYEKAHQQLLRAVVSDPNYAEAWLLEGEVGMETKDYDLAMLGYEQALSIDSMLFPPAAITLARLYDARFEYKHEIVLLKWYLSKHLGDNANDVTASQLLETAVFRDGAVNHPVAFDPESIGTAVNTINDEYVNMLSFDGSQLLFTRKMPADNGYQKESLFVSYYQDSLWSEPQILVFSDFPEDVDPGAAFISADGKRLYLTGCGWQRDSSCDLYVSEWNGEQWSMPNHLSGSINTRSWESQPCVSSDGRELYFVSRRSGNADIYCSPRNADGSWGEPQNLGTPINTNGTEMAPFLHPDGHTLYFSSDTHVGMGGFDLFMSRRGEDGRWQKPVNLGFPINTQGDEINFFVAADGKTAFISSQRDGGRGGYDIYTFELPEEIRSDSANYLSTVDVMELAPGDAVVLQNIQFEFNSSALTEDSQTGIRMLTDFLKRNPELKVELAGHTDNVGSESYNLKLSTERAESVRSALMTSGIEGERLTAKGYGASRPVAPNDTDEHRALNRRTEMIIIN